MALIRSTLRLLAAFAAAAALGGAAQAQIAFRAAASAGIAIIQDIFHVGAGSTASRDTCGSITPSIPGGNADDTLIALVVAREDGATVTMTGWNSYFSDTFPGQEFRAFIFYRIATGADASTVTQSGTCSSLAAQISRFRTTNTAQPLQTDPILGANWIRQTSDNVDTGTESVSAGSMGLIASFVMDDREPSPASGWSESFSSKFNITRAAAISLYYQLQSAAGTISQSDWALSGAGAIQNYGVIFALRPASLAIAKPAGTASGDVMVASIAFRPKDITPTPPSGWTLVRQTTQSGGDTSRMATYYKAAGASEPSQYTWTFSGGTVTGASGGIASFSGVDTSDPINVEGGNTTPTGVSHTANAITTTVANTMLVGSFEYASSTSGWTPPGGMTEAVDRRSHSSASGDGISLEMTYQTQASVGATGTRTATASAAGGASADTGVAHLLALRPGLIDHFAISHSGAAVACADETITITAHNSGHNPVSANALTVALSTTNGKGSWTGIVAGGGTLSDPTPGDGAASYTFAAGSSSVQLSFRYANLPGATETFGFNVSGGGFSETSGVATAADDPSITFARAGFRFRNVTDGNTTIPTQISGKASDTGFNAKTIRLQAIRTDTLTGACAALFASQTRTVELGAECNNPATCAGAQVTVNGASIATSGDNGGAGAAAYTGISLSFNASSEADTLLSYPDAGQVSLHARHDLDPLVSGFEMIGSSNAFVVRPFGFAFTGMAHGTDHLSTVLGAAGDNFSMTVTGYRWASAEDDGTGNPRTDVVINLTDNGVTPNFAAATTVQVLAGSNLPGVANGALTRQSTGTGDIAAGEFTSGAAAVTDWRYSEVGNVTFTASAGNYLGSGTSVSGRSTMDGTGNRVGRFRPKHFALSAGSITNRAAASPACSPLSTFTYMNERLDLGFTLTAQNTQNATTENYQGAYAKLAVGTFTSLNLGARSGATNLTTRIDSGSSSSGSWSSGAAGVTVQTSVRRATPDNPDGPYTATALGIVPTDSDSVTMNTLDLDVDNNATNDRKNLGVTAVLRFGRLRVLGAIGSEKLPLAVPIRTEYWTGTGFATNTLDGCTSLMRNNVSLSFSPASNLSDSNCETAISAATISFVSGEGSLTLAAPGTGNNGSVLLTPELRSAATGNRCSAVGAAPAASTPASMGYLLGRWNDASNPDVATDPTDTLTKFDDNPSARAAFGVYGAQPRNFIYFRENY